MSKLKMILLLAVVFAFKLSAQKAQIVSELPFMGSTSNFIFVMFHVDAELAQSLLPEGIKVRVDDNGKAIANYEILEIERAYGQPLFYESFISVQLEGFESSNGQGSNWAVWGRVDNEHVLQCFQSELGFPYELQADIFTKKEGAKHWGRVGAPGNETIKLQLEANAEKPLRGEGLVNMCGQRPDGQIVYAPVTWMSDGAQAQVLEFKVEPRGNKALEMIQQGQIIWSMVSWGQYFTYTKPIVP